MKFSRLPFSWCLLVPAGALFAQLTVAPTLTTPPHVQYPPIARAAHAEGEVVVTFSIDSEGRTIALQTISGPAMLSRVVEDQIRQWRFKTPLPITAQEDFKATYTFRMNRKEEDVEDLLDAPPFIPCCGDDLFMPDDVVTGDVQSTDGSQRIDLTAGPVARRNVCPEDRNRTPPRETLPDDFVELYRVTCMEECTDYLVRVYRDGRVQWHGWHAVATPGDIPSHIAPAAAEALLALFQSPEFWSVCSVNLNPWVPEHDPERTSPSPSMTVSIDSHVKSVDFTYPSLVGNPLGEKLMWAIDKAADTHHWRHPDAASEPYTNMPDDLLLPKPGITALMRATYSFSPSIGQQTLEPLKRLIASGADIDATDESGWTALFYATYLDSNDPSALNLLLDAHANVNHASLHGDSALMIAAYRGELNENLLRKGADINAHNSDGVTSLMLLAQHANPDKLQQALQMGANPSAQDSSGRTALDYLRAASCQKPLIPLPGPQVQIVPIEPAPCPSNSKDFLDSQALLQQPIAKFSQVAGH